MPFRASVYLSHLLSGTSDFFTSKFCSVISWLFRVLHRGGPGFDPRSIKVLSSLNCHRGRFPQSISVPPANFYFTNCSMQVCLPGLVQWAQRGPTYRLDAVSPHPANLRKVRFELGTMVPYPVCKRESSA
jgi:hypothetical protein